MAILTKSLPINMAAMNLSSLVNNLWMLWARFMPLAIIWRRRILLNPITAVSDAEKKKENAAKINKKIKTAGME